MFYFNLFGDEGGDRLEIKKHSIAGIKKEQVKCQTAFLPAPLLLYLQCYAFIDRSY